MLMDRSDFELIAHKANDPPTYRPGYTLADMTRPIGDRAPPRAGTITVSKPPSNPLTQLP
jgi:hypothetical protein